MVTLMANLSSGLQAGQLIIRKLASSQIKSLFNTHAEFHSNWNNKDYSMRNYKTDAKLLLTALY